MVHYYGYWNYYSDDFDWPNNCYPPNLEKTRQIYSDLGLQTAEAEALISSGYVNIHGDIIIDRYYGGALASSDSATRIHKDYFSEWYRMAKAGEPSRRAVFLNTAKSFDELTRQVNKIQESLGEKLLFRGQINHYETTRSIRNPYLLIEGLGETSLIPSIWRNLLWNQPQSFHHFNGLDLFEWSKIIYSQFDIEEVDRRVDELIKRGESIYSAQDMEDSDDPLVSLFGRVRLDLTMCQNYNLADLLNTLLQHYGLFSPYLDLSSDLRVATFFASHRFVPNAGDNHYQFVGSNGSKSILYLFKHKQNEMAEYAHDRVLHDLQPLRPKRQSCVVCRSSPYALNLAGLYLVGAIRIDFELPESERLSVPELFPDEHEDNFLSALIGNCMHPERVTTFRHR
ncbi:FRG domain-containing protein [Pectobacterium carotovorum]|uniref:FRG domain-containing protein n=1 Tax=Pectobacterium carotovorum TaxID=554 RepID=UPI003018378E